MYEVAWEHRGVEQFEFNARGLEVIDVRGGLYKHQ